MTLSVPNFKIASLIDFLILSLFVRLTSKGRKFEFFSGLTKQLLIHNHDIFIVVAVILLRSSLTSERQIPVDTPVIIQTFIKTDVFFFFSS